MLRKYNSLDELDLMKRSDKVYALVDCDSFFASCEVYRNPKLIGKPVCVGRLNDIIVASTYEAKRYGVKTGTPYWEAKRILGDKMVLVEPDFSLYSTVSKKLMGYLGDIANSIEVFSVDEAFLDITGLDKVYNLSYEQLIHKLKLAVKQKIGIPISVGTSYTKLLAKIFVRLGKPFGTFFVLIQRRSMRH